MSQGHHRLRFGKRQGEIQGWADIVSGFTHQDWHMVSNTAARDAHHDVRVLQCKTTAAQCVAATRCITPAAATRISSAPSTQTTVCP